MGFPPLTTQHICMMKNWSKETLICKYVYIEKLSIFYCLLACFWQISDIWGSYWLLKQKYDYPPFKKSIHTVWERSSTMWEGKNIPWKHKILIWRILKFTIWLFALNCCLRCFENSNLYAFLQSLIRHDASSTYNICQKWRKLKYQFWKG